MCTTRRYLRAEVHEYIKEWLRKIVFSNIYIYWNNVLSYQCYR